MTSIFAQTATTQPDVPALTPLPPTPAPSEPAVRFGTVLLAVGIVVLAAWGFRRLARPRKLLLRSVPGRPNRLTAAHVTAVLLGYFIMQAAAIWMLTRVAGLPIEEVHRSAASFGAMLAVQAAWIAVLLLVAHVTFRHGVGNGLGLTWRHWLWDSLRGLVGMLGAWPVCIALAALTTWLWPPSHEHDVLQALADPAAGMPAKVLAVIAAVVGAPLVEELMYRGILQSALRKVLPPWPAILLASALFALSHGDLWQTMPALFALAIALGYNYERCGRLWPSILMHALFNAVSVTMTLLQAAT